MFETLQETLFTKVIVVFKTWDHYKSDADSKNNYKEMIHKMGLISTTLSSYALSSRVLYTWVDGSSSSIGLEFTVKPFCMSDLTLGIKTICPDVCVNGGRKFKHFTIIFD